MAHQSDNNQHMPGEDLPGIQPQELFLPQPTLPGPGQATDIDICETGVLTETFHYLGLSFPAINLFGFLGSQVKEICASENSKKHKKRKKTHQTNNPKIK